MKSVEKKGIGEGVRFIWLEFWRLLGRFRSECRLVEGRLRLRGKIWN